MIKKLKTFLKSSATVRSIYRKSPILKSTVALFKRPVYDHDGMKLYGKNVEFLADELFNESYRKGMNSYNKTVHIEWRVHMICWAAHHASRLEGDFVECGVNTGIFSLAICNYLDFNSLDKQFFLFDTFCGIPEAQMLESELVDRLESNEAIYKECFEECRENFSLYPRVQLVRGMVPDSLSTVEIEKVSYLSIDMNIAKPELAAMEYFWDKLVTGAVVVFDDYGFSHFSEQKVALDGFASKKGVKIATLPTGQGLLLKS